MIILIIKGSIRQLKTIKNKRMKSIKAFFFPRKFFSKEDDIKIITAIKEAEKDTSGEIRVHFEKNLKGSFWIQL